MSHKDKKGKQSTRNPEDEVQDKSSRIIKRHPSRLLGAGRDVVTSGNRPPATEAQEDVERIRPNTRPNTPGTQETPEGAGRAPTNRPARSKSLTTPDVERNRPNTRPNTPGTQETQEGAGRDVATPTNRPARSKTPVTPNVERVQPNTRPNVERVQPNTRPNIPGSVGQNISSSSLSSQSRIDNIKELQARKPNIRLPSNLFNIFKKTAPPAEDLPTGLFFGRIMNTVNLLTKYILLFLGNDDELKQQIHDLRIQNHQLERRNREFSDQIETLKAKITSLKDENEMLMSINEVFGQENEQLTDEIKRFRSFRIPRSLQSTQSSSQLRSSDKDLADGEDESSFRPVKRKRNKTKGKRIARNDDGEERDDEEARVCNIHQLTLVSLYMLVLPNCFFIYNIYN